MDAFGSGGGDAGGGEYEEVLESGRDEEDAYVVLRRPKHLGSEGNASMLQVSRFQHAFVICAPHTLHKLISNGISGDLECLAER